MAKYYDLSKQKKAVDATYDANDDTVVGTNYNDIIHSGGGNDVVSGGNGNDTLFGGTGNDQIWGDSFLNASLANDNGQDNVYSDHTVIDPTEMTAHNPPLSARR